MRVAVIGAGPGGGAAALRLAEAGVPVTFYALSKRGEKPCGGGLPDYLLPRLPGFDPSPLPRAEPRRVRIDAGLGFTVRRPVEGLSIFRRRDLDAALADAAEAAGARRLDERIVELAWSVPLRSGPWGEERPNVRTSQRNEEEFDVVIAADGARGLSRRTLAGLPEEGALFRPRGESIGMGASVDGLESDELVLSLPDVGDAYGWIFPRPGGVSVGVAYTPTEMAAAGLPDGAARNLLAALVSRRLPGAGSLQPKYRYPIPVYGPWTLPAVRAAARRRVLLVGDAAAVADPLTREGIRQSVLSGLWAAESLLADIEAGRRRGSTGGPFRPDTYPDRLEAALEPEMSRARRAAGLFFAGRLGQAMVPVCRLHPGIGRVLGDLLTCRQPYRGLSRRLLRAAAFLPPAAGDAPLGAAPAPPSGSS